MNLVLLHEREVMYTVLIMATPEKKRRGRPKTGGAPKNKDRHTKPRKAFHDDQFVFDALTKYCESLEVAPDESSVLRLALHEFLVKRGFLKPNVKAVE